MKLPRFTLQTLFIAVTLIAAFLGWRLWELRDRQQLICDQCVAYTVSNLHFLEMDDKRFEVLDKSLSNSLNPNPANRCTFLLPSGKFRDGIAADSFEQQLLADWSTASAGAVSPNETAIRRPFGPSSPTTRRSARQILSALTAIRV